MCLRWHFILWKGLAHSHYKSNLKQGSVLMQALFYAKIFKEERKGGIKGGSEEGFVQWDFVGVFIEIFSEIVGSAQEKHVVHSGKGEEYFPREIKC